MIVTKTAFPENSILYRIGKPFDYADSFKASFKDPDKHITTTEVGKAFFSSAPGWVEHLFAFRNSLVSSIGLKTSSTHGNRQELLRDFSCEPGEQLGLFRVFSKTSTEVVMGADDSHLNFRISLLLQDSLTGPAEKQLTLSTAVEYNNRLGRLYFLPVKPFHLLIVPAMLKAITKQLEKPRVIQL
jgi:hypothetical protein